MSSSREDGKEECSCASNPNVALYSVPCVAQRDDSDCGVACAAMLLAAIVCEYHGSQKCCTAYPCGAGVCHAAYDVMRRNITAAATSAQTGEANNRDCTINADEDESEALWTIELFAALCTAVQTCQHSIDPRCVDQRQSRDSSGPPTHLHVYLTYYTVCAGVDPRHLEKPFYAQQQQKLASERNMIEWLFREMRRGRQGNAANRGVQSPTTLSAPRLTSCVVERKLSTSQLAERLKRGRQSELAVTTLRGKLTKRVYLCLIDSSKQNPLRSVGSSPFLPRELGKQKEDEGIDHHQQEVELGGSAAAADHYCGHFILLSGYDWESREFIYRDPHHPTVNADVPSNERNSCNSDSCWHRMSHARLDECRRSDGTDFDVIEADIYICND